MNVLWFVFLGAVAEGSALNEQELDLLESWYDQHDSSISDLSSPGSPSFQAVTMLGRAAVIQAMRDDFHMQPDQIALRIWSGLPVEDWVDIKDIESIRYEIALPLVQPVEFHQLVLGFKGGLRSPANPVFMHYLRSNLPSYSPLRRDPARLERAILIWVPYCIAPLEVWNDFALIYPRESMSPPPCFEKTIVRNGKTMVAFVIGKEMIDEYLKYELGRALSL